MPMRLCLETNTIMLQELLLIKEFYKRLDSLILKT